MESKPQAKSRYRIGIDVGGTFTHAAAIDAATGLLVGKSKVPTTHRSQWGVGEGVVASLNEVMASVGIQPEQIMLVAHSTTQATNSLLEGDVDPVAIISIGSGAPGAIAARTARLGAIPLAQGKFLKTFSHHLNPKSSGHTEALDAFLAKIKAQGVRVVVVAAPFSVDDASQEQAVADYARAQGFTVTATHEVSQLYGLKIRTRTTAINASILPKMMEVATHTESQIRKAGITAPFLIMRSDGGVMTIEEMRKKPILTLLSGPAAGIAAALRYLRITDGIFIEVGGTSTDISVIKNGRAITRTAVIGGNKTFLKTLDCRTLGIGGGSVPRVKLSSSGTIESVIDVGPRSAHIAGLKYAAFEATPASPALSGVSPRDGDPSDYFKIASRGGVDLTWTPTCSSNTLGLVPVGDPARAREGFAKDWEGEPERCLGISREELSRQILDHASNKVAETVTQLIKEYRLEPSWTTLVGGGGGASAIVPHLARKLGMKFEIARDADVISAIGVALGMIREVVEKSILHPTSEDIYRIRSEARQKVIAQGADPESVETLIEVDQKRNIVTAEAQGSIEFKRGAGQASTGKQAAGENTQRTDSEILAEAQSAFSLATRPRMGQVLRARSLTALTVSTHPARGWKSWLGETLGFASAQERTYAMVRDDRGIVRLRLSEARIFGSRTAELLNTLRSALEETAVFGDGGIQYPAVYAIIGDRLVDLSKLSSPDHLQSVLALELKDVPAEEPAVLITSLGAMENA